MDSLRINTGAKKILINDGPECIEFNPHDVAFVERFYSLLSEFEGKLDEYQKRSEALDSDKAIDENGLPANIPERIAFMREACEYLRGQIDKLFGEGTSKAAFGDTLSLDIFTQFFEGITPFIQAARQEKMAKYAPSIKKKSRVMK